MIISLSMCDATQASVLVVVLPPASQDCMVGTYHKQFYSWGLLFVYVNVYKYKYILEQEVHRQTTQDSQQDLNKEKMLHANDAEVFFMQTLL